MKILLLSPLPPYRGGIAQFGSRLLSEITRIHPETTGLNYKRLYPSILFPGKTQLEQGESPPEGVLHGYNPFSWKKSSKLISRMEPDLIISQWWHPFFAPCLSSSIPTGVKTAAICHNIEPHESIPLANSLSRSFLRKQNLLAVHSKTAYQKAKELGPEVVRLFHPVYDQYLGTGLPREEARRKLGLGENQTALLFFGLVRHYKGLDLLIKACEQLPSRFRIIAAGENYTGHSFQSDRLLWKDDFIPDFDVGTWFNAADIVVLPYRSATQSGIAQIALAFGKPMVVTPVGGLPESVDDGKTGKVAVSTEVPSLVEAIRECEALIQQNDLSESISSKAESFSWQTYVSKLLEAIS